MMSRPIVASDRPGWHLQIVQWNDAPLDRLAALAHRLVDSAGAEFREQLRDLLDVAVAVLAPALSGVAGVPPESRRRIRATGAALATAGLATETVIAHFGALTSAAARMVGQQPAPDPVLLVTAGNLLVQEFLAGVAERAAVASPPRSPAATPAELVRCLVEHGTAPTDTHLALAYVVVVVDLPEPREETLTDITGALAPYGPGVLAAPEPFGAVVLVPDAADDGEGRIAERLAAGLGAGTWGAVAARTRPELPSAYQEAVQVLALARAARRDPGIYRRADFLLEFAAARDDAVAADLVTIIEPLMSSAVLYETLEALIDADFNRSRAAKILFVHRSTLDYRLHRIEEITGRSPATVQGAQVLSVARTVYLTRASTAR